MAFRIRNPVEFWGTINLRPNGSTSGPSGFMTQSNSADRTYTFPDVTGTVSLTSDVITQVLTGFTAGTGSIAATDTILQAFQKTVDTSSTQTIAGAKTMSSLTFSGGSIGTSVTGVTQTVGTNNTSLATTAFVLANSVTTASIPLYGVYRTPVRAVGTTNVTISGPGTTLDGYTLVSGDRILLTGQTTTSQNGIWIFNGSAAALTRPTDYSSGSTSQATYGITIEVLAGTTGIGSLWYLNTTGAITIDTTGTTWTQEVLNLSNASGLSGTLAATSFPALTGDVTTAGGALATTLATAQAGPHTWSNAQSFTGAVNLNGASNSLTIAPTTSGALINLNSVTGQNSNIQFSSNSVQRNLIQLQSSGTDLLFNSYDTSGTFIDTPLKINNTAGGNVTFTRPLLGTVITASDSTTNVIEKSLTVVFAASTANQKADIRFGNNPFQGTLEITVTTSSAAVNLNGAVIKRYALSLNTGGTSGENSSRFTEAFGNVAGAAGFTLSDVTWDGTNTTWRVQVVNSGTAGNKANIRIKAITQGASQATFVNSATVTAAYTTDVTVFSAPVVNYGAALTTILTDSVTSATSTVLTIGHNSSGTPAAGFGSVVNYQLKDSSTINTTAADETTTWVVATHGSTTARKVFNIWDTAAREALRMEASGTAAKIGFLGATAVVKQTGDAGTALVTLGLMSGTPTFGAANLTGTLAAGQFPALTGDVTSAGATLTTAIAAATVTGKVLTGYAVGANSALAATDTILGAFGKVQGQLNAALISPMTTLGDIIYEDATPAAARLAGNTTTTNKFLTQVGNGTISSAPAWSTIVSTDIATALTTPGPIGATTANTGTFTTVNATIFNTTSTSMGNASNVSTWVKYTISYAALAAAATTATQTLDSLPAGGFIHAIKIKHSTAFSGGALTGYTVGIGTGGATTLTSDYNVFQAVGNTVFYVANQAPATYDHAATTTIQIIAKSVGANTNAATAGSVDIWLLVSKAV